MSSTAETLREEYLKHDHVDHERIDEVFDELWNAGERDGLDGGVHPKSIEKQLPYHKSTIANHLDSSDDYVRVDGISPSGDIRTSFAPAGDSR